MCTAFDNLSIVHHQQSRGIPHRREPVSHDKHRAALSEPFERLSHRPFPDVGRRLARRFLREKSQGLLLPELPVAVEEAARALFAEAGDPLPELEHDPEPTFAEAAYRGAQAAGAAEFHGFALGTAAKRAVERRARFAYAEGVHNARVECFAQPFLVARYDLDGTARTAILLVGGARRYAACVVEDA